MKLVVLIVFLIAYTAIIFLNKKVNPFISLFGGVGIILLVGALSLKGALLSINFNVLGIFIGTMILSQLFIASNVPAYLAVFLVRRSANVGMAILFICLLAGFISSFTENVATVLIVAPIAFEIAKKLKANPIPFLIGIAVSSNLQGCATMIGDSPSLLLAMAHNMNFMEFFWMKGKPGITFAVEIGAIFSYWVLYLLFKKFKDPVIDIEGIKIKSMTPTILIICMLTTLAISSFIQNKPYYTIASICLGYGFIGLVWNKFAFKEKLVDMIKGIDWKTFFFLIGVFILIGALTEVGLIKDIANFMADISKGNIFIAFTLIVWISVLLSAFIDNIPYVMAMIPVAKLLAVNLNISPEILLFGLLIGASLGGNITPIGASANIVAIGMLRERGYIVSFKEFMKIGLPFTLAAVIPAYIFLWFVWR